MPTRATHYVGNTDIIFFVVVPKSLFCRNPLQYMSLE